METKRDIALPEILKPLAPYIKSRQEALDIRRILSVFLAQHIYDPYGDLNLATTLALPSEGTQVRLIAPQLTGIRRSYLHALQAHIKAQEAYSQLSARLADNKIRAKRQDQRETENHEQISTITLHNLLHEQCRYQKLNILRNALGLLANQDAAQSDYLNVNHFLKKSSSPPEVPSTFSTPLIYAAEDETQALILTLEKAVLQAQNAFENEKLLLDEAKKNYRNQMARRGPDAKVSALHRVKDELINWLELRLMSINQADNPPETLPISSPEAFVSDIHQRVEHIQSQYHKYLDARKNLLLYMSSDRRNSVQKISPTSKEVVLPLSPKHEIARDAHEANLVLPYLTEYFIPNADHTKAVNLHSSHLSRSLRTEVQETERTLHVLAAESHLLSKYQSSAADPSFRKDLASQGPAHFHPKGTIKSSTAHIVTQAQGWAHAASAARSAQGKAFEEILQCGEQEANDASNILQELQEMVGLQHDKNRAHRRDPKLIAPNQDSSKTKFSDDDDRNSKGVWAGFSGKLGIDEQRG